jgi:hypothetical protein
MLAMAGKITPYAGVAGRDYIIAFSIVLAILLAALILGPKDCEPGSIRDTFTNCCLAGSVEALFTDCRH